MYKLYLQGGTRMEIGSIQRISAMAPSSSVISATATSKTLQSQLQMKQQNLKNLSYDTSLSKEEKAKQEQAYKKEIEELKRKLEQLRQKQEKEEDLEKVKENTKAESKKIDKAESQKEVCDEDSENNAVLQNNKKNLEIKELSLDEVQKILDDNFALKETMIEQGAAYDKENYVRRLTAEIKQDQLLNADTSSKEAQLEKLLTQENHWQNAKTKQTTAEPAPIIHPDIQVSIN